MKEQAKALHTYVLIAGVLLGIFGASPVIHNIDVRHLLLELAVGTNTIAAIIAARWMSSEDRALIAQAKSDPKALEGSSER